MVLNKEKVLSISNEDNTQLTSTTVSLRKVAG